MPLLIWDGDYVEQIEPTPLIVEEMDDTEGEAAEIFSQVKERKKMKWLEINPSKTTQPPSSTPQEALATHNTLLATNPQVTSHSKITILGLCPRENSQPHKACFISIEEVREI